MVNGNVVPLDHVAQIRIAALEVVLQLRVDEGRPLPWPRNLHWLSDFGHVRSPSSPASTSVSLLVKGATKRASGEASESGSTVSGSVWSMWTCVSRTADAFVTSAGASGGGRCAAGCRPHRPSQ